jgi:hypothetical protein
VRPSNRIVAGGRLAGPDRGGLMRATRAAVAAGATRPQGSTRTAVRAALLTLASVGCLVAAGARAVEFELQRLPVADYYLDDLGVADVDGDGDLDVFTTNHNARQRLSLNDGRGSFVAVDAAAAGMAQNPAFPGLTDATVGPEATAGTLQVFSRRGRLFLRGNKLAATGGITGRLYLDSSPAVRARGFDHSVSCDGAAAHPCRLDFRVADSGVLRLDDKIDQYPMRLVIGAGAEPERVRLGRDGIAAPGRDLQLRLMDRHGMAWSDLDGNGEPDAYVNNGGYGGELAALRARHPEIDYNNELFCQADGGFRPCIEGRGLVKDDDRGRRVAWVDFDGDGRLDLYLDNRDTPNRLFRQRKDGTFADRAPAKGLAAVASGPFVWFDADNDLDPDLLLVEADRIVLYRREPPGYGREDVGAYRGGTKNWSYGTFSLFDADGDGYLEALLASSRGSSYVENAAGRLSARPVAELGLPDRSHSLDFVDIDADGLVEIHAVARDCAADGIYRLPGAQGDAPAIPLPALRANYCSIARSLWFDADGNGFPDLLLARKTRAASRRLWQTHLLANQGNEHHWLQVDLRGPPGNPEAIGARVTLRAGGRSQVRQVGQFEGSRYSQGHYRLYFGLGRTARADALIVHWPDGRRTRLDDPAVDRRLRVVHPQARP